MAIDPSSEVSVKGMVPANGQLLPIASHEALYSLYGARFGGDGVTTFALPAAVLPAVTLSIIGEPSVRRPAAGEAGPLTTP